MTEAYDRIWAGVRTDEFRGMVGTKIRVWGNDPRVGTDDPATEYVRADLVEAMEAENQRLRESLREIEELNLTTMDENGHRWENSDLIGQEIRAALRSTEEG